MRGKSPHKTFNKKVVDTPRAFCYYNKAVKRRKSLGIDFLKKLDNNV